MVAGRGALGHGIRHHVAGFEPVKAGDIEQSGRLEVGGDLHDLVVGPAKARSLIGGA